MVKVIVVPIAATAFALTVFSVVFLLLGRNPLVVFGILFSSAFGSSFGVSESVVRTIPVMLCALAVALPAWVGLLNIGGEGQFHLGAIGAGLAALLFTGSSAIVILPTMFIAAVVAGGLWGAAAGFLRARWGVNETIVTLLMNFVAVLFLEFLVHGPLRDPASFNWPYSQAFSSSAVLPSLPGTRIHIGLVIALAIALLLLLVWRRTTFGFAMRVIEDNPTVARLAAIRVDKYYFWCLVIAGGIAAIAGMAEISVIQGRLRPGISPGYGFNGFLVSWIAGHRPIPIIVVSFLVGGLLVGVDGLQVNLNLPFSTVNILLGLVFIAILVGNRLFFSQGRQTV